MKTTGFKNGLLISGMLLLMSLTTFANTEGGKTLKKKNPDIVKLFDQVREWTSSFNEVELKIESWMTRSDYLELEVISRALENELELEAWMLNTSYLTPSWLEAEQEMELPIENWMCKSLDLVMDSELELEDWMTNGDYLNADYLQIEQEPELEFESWMFKQL